MTKMLLLFLLLQQSPEELYTAASADMSAQRWADAAAKFEQILKLEPGHLATEFNLAISYSRLGNSERAEALYRKILVQDETLFEARMNLAIMLDESGKAAVARIEFEKASRLRPDDPLPVLFQAQILDRQGDVKGAGEIYLRAIALDPANAETRLQLGLLLMNAGQVADAYPHLMAAEQSGFQNPQLFLALSEAEHQRNNESQSLSWLEKAAALDPGDSKVQYQLGVVYRDLKQFDKAIQVLQPLLPETRVELALSYYDNRNWMEAEVLFRDLVAAEPKNPDYLYMLGKSLIELKRHAEAVTQLHAVLELRPDDVEAWGGLGSTYYILENWPSAIIALEKFKEFKPQQALAYFLLGSSYDHLDNWQAALVNYNRFLELDDGSNDARSFQAKTRAQTLARRKG